MNDKKNTNRKYPLKCPTCGGYLSFSKRTFEQFTYCNSCSYDSRIDALKAEVEKWRTAASVLCAAHVGKPQSSCPVCEVEKLKAEQYSVRDYFAGQALIRVIPTEGWVDHAVSKEAATAARQAYAIADAMIAERKRKEAK